MRTALIETIDIDPLWPAPLAAGELAAFERLLSDRLERDLAPPPGPERREAVTRLKLRIKAAWDGNRLPEFVGAASALHGIGGLNPAYVRRLAWALTTQGRFAEAAALFADVLEDDHRRWFDQARSLAGAGRLDEAAYAAARCLGQLESGPFDPDLEAAVKGLDRRRSALDVAAGWTAARAAIRDHIQAGRRESASQGLRRFFADRAGLLVRATAATAPPASRSWAELRARIAAAMLLGLGPAAAEFILAAAREGLAAPPQAIGEAAALLKAIAAAAPPESQSELLEAMAALAGPGAEADLLRLAVRVIGEAAPWLAIVESPKPSPALRRLVATALGRAGQLEPAIAMFGEMAKGKGGQEARLELACCQSAQTISSVRARTTARPRPARVFDVFPYNGELDLLKIKLSEMAPWVDRFVLVEAAETFTGRPKPLYFEADRAALSAFLPRIVHVVVRRFAGRATAPWAREFHQRDEAVKGLQGLWAPQDLVLLTDADEVIDHRALEGFSGDAAPLRMHTLRYFLNYRLDVSGAAQKGGPSVWRAELLERFGPSLARTVLASSLGASRIQDAGWHFTSIGDARALARKLGSYSHEENDRPGSEGHYGALLARLRAGEREPGWEVCAPERLPAYVRDNRARLEHLLL